MILAKGKIAKKPYELSYLGSIIYSLKNCAVIYYNIYGDKRGIFSDLSGKMDEGRTGIGVN